MERLLEVIIEEGKVVVRKAYGKAESNDRGYDDPPAVKAFGWGILVVIRWKQLDHYKTSSGVS